MGKRIPIDEMLISWINRFSYQGRDLAEEFMGKDQDKVITQNMKEKFDLVKKM